MKKKIIFWTIVLVLLIGFGVWLKYTPFGVTVVTVVACFVSAVLGWIARILYSKYIKG